MDLWASWAITILEGDFTNWISSLRFPVVKAVVMLPWADNTWFLRKQDLICNTTGKCYSDTATADFFFLFFFLKVPLNYRVSVVSTKLSLMYRSSSISLAKWSSEHLCMCMYEEVEHYFFFFAFSYLTFLHSAEEIRFCLLSAIFSCYKITEATRRKTRPVKLRCLVEAFVSLLISVLVWLLTAKCFSCYASEKYQIVPTPTCKALSFSFFFFMFTAHYRYWAPPHKSVSHFLYVENKLQRERGCIYMTVDSLPLWVVRAGSRPWIYSWHQQGDTKLSHSFHASLSGRSRHLNILLEMLIAAMFRNRRQEEEA